MARVGRGERVEGPRPATSAETPERIWSPLFVVVSMTLAAVMVLAGLGGIYDPAFGHGDGSMIGAWLWVAAWGALGLRATMPGASVRGNRLRIRSLWRTRDIPVIEVERVDTDYYEGFLLGFLSLTWLRTVRVRVGGKWVRAWPLTSGPRAAARLAGRLELACGVQPTPKARPRLGPSF